MSQTEYIIERYKRNGLVIDELSAEKLTSYYSTLVDKNKVMNLTAITEFEEVVDKHFIDSAVLGKYTSFNDKTVIDVGTGAGFPGIPLKIMFPDMKLTLLDSLNKRIGFLNEVIDELGLKGVTTVHARAEEFARQKEQREHYDVVVSRAVSNLSTLAEYCLPFVHVHGEFFSYKGSKAAEEIEEAKTAIKILGGKVEETIGVSIESTDYERNIVRILKCFSTPSKYPRTGNKPLTNPLH